MPRQKSWIETVGVERMNELGSESVRMAVTEHHTAGQAVCGSDSQGHLYLLFPDQSERFFPADMFPFSDDVQRPYFLKWCEFVRELYRLLTLEEWHGVQVRYGHRQNHGAFCAEIDPDGLSAEHLQVARELAQRIESEHRTEQEYLA